METLINGSSIEAFQRFDEYDFRRDEEFQNGLETILASNPQTSPDMILMAKVFFYSKKVEAIDLQDYKAWKTPVRPLTEAEIENALLTQDLSASRGPQYTKKEGTISATTAVPRETGTKKPDDMPYPATFDEIVELIKSGKPIPGIKTIPDKTAEGETSVSEAKPRLKPWELSENGAIPPDSTKSTMSLFDTLPEP